MGYPAHTRLGWVHDSHVHCVEFLVGGDIRARCQESAGEFEEPKHVDQGTEKGLSCQVD